MTKFLQALLLATISFFLGGCASTVTREDIRIYKENDTSTYAGALKYSTVLADKYLDLSSNARTFQDLVAVGLIGAAGVASGGALYGSSLDLIKGAGLAAGATSALSSYVRPAKHSNDLLLAAEQLTCVWKAGNAYTGSRNNAEAVEILKSGIRTIRINLRKKLNRDIPNYAQLVENLKQSSQIANKLINNKNFTIKSNFTEILSEEINKCVLLTG